MEVSKEVLRNGLINSLAEIAPEIKDLSFSNDESLQDQLELDSVDMIRYVSNVQETFGVNIDSKDLSSFLTIDSGIKYLEKLKS